MNSDDSNEEKKSEIIKTQNKVIRKISDKRLNLSLDLTRNHKDESDINPDLTNGDNRNFKRQNTISTSNVVTSNAFTATSTPLETTASEDKTNFIGSFKNFLTKKFSSKNLIKKEETSTPVAESGTDSVKEKQSEDSNAAFRKQFATQTSIDNYKQILENFKDILPEDFTLRKFPYSSCPDTFETSELVEISNSVQSAAAINQSNFISVPSTSASASSSASPVNQEAVPILDSVFEKQLADVTSTIEGTLECSLNPSVQEEEDLENSANKRFYHVFRKTELDNLIRENCPNLVIYDSYYDHGNWCICALKE